MISPIKRPSLLQVQINFISVGEMKNVFQLRTSSNRNRNKLHMYGLKPGGNNTSHAIMIQIGARAREREREDIFLLGIYPSLTNGVCFSSNLHPSSALSSDPSILLEMCKTNSTKKQTNFRI